MAFLIKLPSRPKCPIVFLLKNSKNDQFKWMAFNSFAKSKTKLICDTGESVI